MSNTERPLSPHLSIYRWPITMTLSILHRVTGVMMSVALLLLAGWLASVSQAGASYGVVLRLLSAWPGQLFLMALSFAFFLHLANGVRHLVWDFGHGFEIKQANASAWFVLLFAVAMTFVFWCLL
jgi:succinate dehydrogenase cytochrome b subunit